MEIEEIKCCYCKKKYSDEDLNVLYCDILKALPGITWDDTADKIKDAIDNFKKKGGKNYV